MNFENNIVQYIIINTTHKLIFYQSYNAYVLEYYNFIRLLIWWFNFICSNLLKCYFIYNLFYLKKKSIKSNKTEPKKFNPSLDRQLLKSKTESNQNQIFKFNLCLSS